MCFYSKLSKKALELENRFKAEMQEKELFDREDQHLYNGFAFPDTPVIANDAPSQIRLFGWGLIPFWAKNRDIQKNTLNARVETIHEKPSFRSCINNRCLVISDGFFEWKWLDEKGKKKQKYLLSIGNDDIFTFAGIYSKWTDKETGELLHTYSIVTTKAIGLMDEIHNSKHRMPLILERDMEHEWLNGADPGRFLKENHELHASMLQ